MCVIHPPPHVNINFPLPRRLTQTLRQKHPINYRRPRITTPLIRVTPRNLQTRLPNGLHINTLQTLQRVLPCTSTSSQIHQTIIDFLRFRSIVFIRLRPKRARSQSSRKKGWAGTTRISNNLRHDTSSARRLSTYRHIPWIASKMARVFMCPSQGSVLI